MEAINDAEWDREWKSMEVRLLTDLQYLDSLSLFDRQFGSPLSATISKVPERFVDKLYFPEDECPVCGLPTAGGERSPANLCSRFEKIQNLGVGVWVHSNCFETLPVSNTPPPIPW